MSYISIKGLGKPKEGFVPIRGLETGPAFDNKYGASKISFDPITKRPTLTFKKNIFKTFLSPEKVIEFEDPTRVAPSFDFTRPQEITREVLRNDRMPSSVSQAIREKVGAGYSEELDHQIALTLSGSNLGLNLEVIDKAKNRQFGTEESKLANQVISGEISLLDAQRQMAKEKGFTLPEDFRKPSAIQRWLLNAQFTKRDGTKESVLVPLTKLQEDFTKSFTRWKNPRKAVDEIFGKAKEVMVESVNELASSVVKLYASRDDIEVKTNAINAANAAVGTFFSPIGALLTVLGELPGVTPTQAAIEELMKGIDNLAHDSVTRIIDTVPNEVMDIQAKDQISESVGGAFSTIAQFATFAKIAPDFAVNAKAMYAKWVVKESVIAVAKGEKLARPQVQEILAKAEVEAVKTLKEQNPIILKDVPLDTKMGDLLEVARVRGFGEEIKFAEKPKPKEPPAPPKKIEFKPIEGLKTIEAEKPIPTKLKPLLKEAKKFETVEEFIEAQGIDKVKTEAQLTDIFNQAKGARVKEVIVEEKVPTKKKPVKEVPRKVQPGEKPTKIGKSIEAKAIEAKLTEGFSEVAGFDPKTIKEQSRLTSELISKDNARARRIVRGEESLPSEINPMSFVIAMEEFVSKNPSAELAFELANSPLVTETSIAAQTLRFAAERTQDAAIVKTQEIKKARQEAAKENTKQTKKEVSEGAKKEMKKNNLTKEEQSWNTFLEKITC